MSPSDTDSAPLPDGASAAQPSPSANTRTDWRDDVPRRFGLLGHRLGHSYSQKYFEEKFRLEGLLGYCYDLIETDNLNALPQLIRRHRLSGFNVTIPYKQAILPLLDELDPVARQIGAVNVVRVCHGPDGFRLHGFNTDAPAFQHTLRLLLASNEAQRAASQSSLTSRALIIGTGGAAAAVGYALSQMGIGHYFVSRHPAAALATSANSQLRVSDVIDYATAQELAADHHLIVNATPVGIYPNIDATPWPSPETLTPQHICYDLIYNPDETIFLRQARQRGSTTKNGLDMLHIQADLAFNIWQDS